MNTMKSIYCSKASQPPIWRPALGLAIIMLILCGGFYATAVTSFAGMLFPQQATGSLVTQNGKQIGSALVSQPFSAAYYFHGRPSSADNDPMATGGSNLAPSNPELRDRVAQTSAALTQEFKVSSSQLPVDLLASSGSGVDPHISPAAALLQIKTVAIARGITPSQLEQLVLQHIEAPQWGIFGQPRVNVLLLNLALDTQYPRQ